MSKMGNIFFDIEDRLINSNDSYQAIAERVGVSVSWVVDIANSIQNDEYIDSDMADSFRLGIATHD